MLLLRLSPNGTTVETALDSSLQQARKREIAMHIYVCMDMVGNAPLDGDAGCINRR
jgi:hypothetical protein